MQSLPGSAWFGGQPDVNKMAGVQDDKCYRESTYKIQGTVTTVSVYRALKVHQGFSDLFKHANLLHPSKNPVVAVLSFPILQVEQSEAQRSKDNLPKVP